MPFPLSAYLVRYNFTLIRASAAEDIANLDLWMAPLGGAEYGDSQLAAAAHGAYNAWDTNQYTGDWGNNVRLDSVVCSSFNAAGHTIHEQNFVPVTPWQGASGGKALPWETSMVVSLYCYQRGVFEPQARRKRGRVYLPPQTASQLENSNAGYYDNSALPTFLGKQKDWLTEAQQDDVGVKIANLSVFSRADSVLRPVVNLYMGAKFGSQRRRQNKETVGILSVPF